jgi:energy-coupling factor transporter ATP-binding protein EcfA2
MLGQEFDFDNLSRGERNRLILGLSWSFRDVFESLNFPCNLLFIDELVDSGMDPVGVDAALAVLKKFSRESKKNVFLISHRDELITRVNNSLQVVKENGFTTFSTDVDMVEA